MNRNADGSIAAQKSLPKRRGIVLAIGVATIAGCATQPVQQESPTYKVGLTWVGKDNRMADAIAWRLKDSEKNPYDAGRLALDAGDRYLATECARELLAENTSASKDQALKLMLRMLPEVKEGAPPQ